MIIVSTRNLKKKAFTGVLYYSKDDFVVVFYRNLRETWKDEQNNKDEKNPKHQNDVLNDVLKDVLQNQIIQFLQKQIAAKTGRSIASVQRAMKKLIKQGKIIREGGKRFGHWKVK